MKKILKKLSLIMVILMSFSILFINNVFADIAVPVSHTSDYIGAVIFTVILALLIVLAIVSMIIVNNKKRENKINEADNLNINNDKDDSQND